MHAIPRVLVDHTTSIADAPKSWAFISSPQTLVVIDDKWHMDKDANKLGCTVAKG